MKTPLTMLACVLVAAAAVGCSSNIGPAPKATADPPPSAVADVAVAHTNLGDVIVDAKGMTAYVFDKDVAGSGTSACTGDCQKLWVAVPAASDQPVAVGIIAPVGVITGAAGSKQITIGGLPVYTYTGDKAPGDTNGQFFKDVWHALTPLGQKIG
jgi:predicted lipoprotein with Yx(FWY)xxD motif